MGDDPGTQTPPSAVRPAHVVDPKDVVLLRRQVGRSLVLLRTERELSQQDLAAAASVSKSYLSQIESGQRLPSAQILERLARALSVTPSEVTQRANVFPAAAAALGVLFGGPFVGAAANLALAWSAKRALNGRNEAEKGTTAAPAGKAPSTAPSYADGEVDQRGLLSVLSQLTSDELQRVRTFAEALLQSRP